MVCNNNSFGPVARGCRNDFDFTLLFEHAVLSMAPSITFIAAGTIRLWYLSTRPIVLRGRPLQFSKLLITSAFAAVQYSLLGLSVSDNSLRSWSATTAAALSAAAATMICLVSYTEHSKTKQPSSLLLIYLFCTLLFDIVQTRTLWLVASSSTFTRVFTAATGVRLCVMVLEAVEKRSYLLNPPDTKCPEGTSSIFNRGVFFWLNSLLWWGAHHSLTLSDLFALHDDLLPEHVASRFTGLWLRFNSRSMRWPLQTAIVRLLMLPILTTILWRLFLLGLTICTPLLLNELLDYLTHAKQSNHHIGHALIGAFALVYFGIALMTGFYWHYHVRTLTMIRSCLVSILSWKTTRLPSTGGNDSTAVLTLMSTDVDRIIIGLDDVHELWANLAQAAIAAVLLKHHLGQVLPSVIPVVISCVCAGGSVWSSRSASKRQRAWSEAVQQRVSFISRILSAIKGVRLRGMEDNLEPMVQEMRTAELLRAKAYRRTLTRTIVLGYTPELITPAATFLILAVRSNQGGHHFDVSVAFTTLALLNILTQPLSASLQALPALFGITACFQRINDFLTLDDHEDLRQFKTIQDEKSPVKGEDGLLAFKMVDCSVGYQMNTPILRHIDINIPQNVMTLIIGPVACGKSTLCRALIGEALMEGRLTTDAEPGSIAYCDQKTFLKGGSIKQNIVGYQALRQPWYDEVIRACALFDDIALLPAKDDTEATTLSGGQKQRVAIARALYACKPILVLDDALSGLDAASERHVYEQALGKYGLARKHGMTVVLATNAMRWLRCSDHILILGSDGSIAQQGSYNHISEQTGFVKDLAAGQESSMDSGEDSIAITHDIQIPRESCDKECLEKSPSSLSNDPGVRRQGDFSVYHYYLNAAGSWNVLVATFLIATVAALYTVPSYWLEIWAIAAEQSHHATYFYWGIYAMLLILALGLLGASAYHIFVHFVTQTGLAMHARLLEAVLNAKWSFFSSTDSGTITNRFSQDLQIIDTRLPSALLNLMLSLFFALGQAILIVVSSPWVGLALPFILATLYLVQKFYLRTSRQLRLLDIEARSPLYTWFREMLEGLASFRALGWIPDRQEHSRSLLEDSQKPVYLLLMIQRWLTFVIDTVVACTATAIAAISICLNADGGPTGLALTQVMSMSLMLRTIIVSWTNLETSIGAVSRIRTFSRIVEAEADVDTSEPAPDWPSEGNINMSNVEASYNASGKSPVLKNINVRIQSGMKVGVCGQSGSSKTSFMLALLRVIDIRGGIVEIDGVDIHRVPRRILRQRVDVIPQDPVILHSTVKENLDPNNRYEDSLLMQALRKVHLWDAIESRGGLTADIDFTTLSHGQRQLFCLCGALLSRAKLVLLDESTSNMDHETDQAVQRVIREEFKNRTVVAIAHRLETVVDFDRIMFMQEGNLIEFDSPKALLAADTQFRRMWNRRHRWD